MHKWPCAVVCLVFLYENLLSAQPLGCWANMNDRGAGTNRNKLIVVANAGAELVHGNLFSMLADSMECGWHGWGSGRAGEARGNQRLKSNKGGEIGVRVD